MRKKNDAVSRTILVLKDRCRERQQNYQQAARTRCPRQSKLQLENLEAREVPAVLAGVGDAPSDVMQASQMSAFFQQSALFTNGQPTTDPTQSWTATRPVERADNVATMPIVALRVIDELEALLDEERKSEESLLDSIGDSGGGRGGAALRLPGLRWERLWPSQVFAPYVDMSEWPTFDLVHGRQAEGIEYYQLAFISADSLNRPAWGGSDQNALGTDFDLSLRRQVSVLRALGGDVAVSFGGPRRLELAQVNTDVDALKRAYRSVIDAYRLSRIDFDLETSALADTPAVERRSQALAALQRELKAEGRPLTVWLTLPAGPGGLDRDALHVVESAIDHGVELGGVNLRPTSQGENGAPAASTRMGAVAIESAINTFYQLDNAYHRQELAGELWRKIGITPTIGRGDAPREQFLPSDARAVLDFARQQGLGMLGIWSLNRDQYDSGEAHSDDGLSSGVDQRAFEFSEILAPFMQTPTSSDR